MQKARQEANMAFKNIPLGQKRKASAADKKTAMSPLTENPKKRLTRLEKCKLEAVNAFGNVALSDLRGTVEARKNFGRRSLSKSKKEQRKSTSKGKPNRRSTSRRSSLRRISSTKSSRLTRVKASQMEVLQSFGGQSLEKVWKSCKQIPTCAEPNELTTGDDGFTDISDPVDSDNVATKDGGIADVSGQLVAENSMAVDTLDVDMVSYDATGNCEETNDNFPIKETVKLSSKQSLELVDEATQVSEPSGSELPTEGPKSNTMSISVAQDQDVCGAAPLNPSCDNQTHRTKALSTIPEPNPCQSSAESNDMQSHSVLPVEPKALTRLEKARLEALQSFHGQAFHQVIKSSSRKMAKYLTPVKHQGTNTNVNKTRNTPSQTEVSYCRRHPLQVSSFYTNLRNNSFCSRDALLESSKVVVSTARSLDTPSPECSPSDTSNP